MSQITVIDVFRSMGREPTPKHTWTVGTQVRLLYEKTTGFPPMKLLRPKTYSGGSHCFAIYPESWRATIREIIETLDTEEETQPELPFQ